VNQLYENQSVRKGDACFTELHFRNIRPPQEKKKMRSTRDKGKMSTVEMQIAERSRRYPGEALTNLQQFIDEEFLEECLSILNKQSASGVDGQSWKAYNEERKERIPELLKGFKSGSYRAPNIRRVYIPKGDGKQRPLGIPTIEDKVLQTAVSKILMPVYEGIFYESSYGFRLGKSQHQALEELFKEVSFQGKRYIIDADMENYFGSISHQWLREFLDRKIKDGVIRKMIDKWLKAGVLEDDQVRYPTEGTPQGGSISPLLSNIYLHYVLDEWFKEEIQPLLKGKSFLIRFADDFLLGFTDGEDARRVMEVLPKRLGRYNLKLHPEKTKLLELDGTQEGKRGFDFLGFTHYMGKSMKGNSILKRKTSGKKLRASLQRMNDWLKFNRHDRLEHLIAELNLKLGGHYQYYGITFNTRKLDCYYETVKRLLHKWSNRCGSRKLSWKQFILRAEVWSPLLKPRIYHSYVLAKP
jgi:group II intron reverse transcriptase/maturase